MKAVEDAFSRFHEVCGHYPTPQIVEQTLRFESGVREHRHDRKEQGDKASIERWDRDGTFDRMRAEHKICCGSLQIVASRMLGQMTQESAGDRELYEGTRLLEEAQKKYK
jgi:hypothetical protein